MSTESQSSADEHHPTGSRILVVRLGAMGDIIHTLPAVASLKQSYPGSRITWMVEPKWAPLLESNPDIDRIALLRRGTAASLFRSWRELRSEGYDLAIDFQGLMKSAAVVCAARADRIFGFAHTQVRERTAALFYSREVLSSSVHVVERNLDLARAAGAVTILKTFALPPGHPEGDLPSGDFVLASPLAGWRAKQWPMEHYGVLAQRLQDDLGVPLVLNGPPASSFPQAGNVLPHQSGLPGLIHATRRATAVVGVDSGPLHLAAALAKPGVAIFGPTDPARNGPYGDSLKVLRTPDAATTYKRGASIDQSMQRISPDEVFETLRLVLGERRHSAGCLA